jgi:hypothetical protein
MAVYVDALFAFEANEAQARRVGARNGHRWSHMMADTVEELHAMATRIGLRRAWFQGDHYDLTPSRRALAVKYGAKEVTSRDLVALRRAQRSG